jgi:predicted DNA-binding transcriptional regulator AlpA
MTTIPTRPRPTRILGSDVVADRLGISLVHLRRLVRTDQFPRPIRIGARKLGWEEAVVEGAIAAARAAADQSARLP